MIAALHPSFLFYASAPTHRDMTLPRACIHTYHNTFDKGLISLGSKI
jgi:hypothetical protein